jgi:dolichol kinase
MLCLSKRPTNHARSLYHALNSLFFLTVAEVVLPPWALLPTTLGVATVLWTGEIARRHFAVAQKLISFLMGFMLHESEQHRVISGTWYMTALVVVAVLGDLELMAVSLAVVGVGDPCAGFVGRRWGRNRIFEARTAEGTVAYALSGTGAALFVLWLWHPEASPYMALAGGVAGALAELFSGRSVDDNLTSPLAAAAAAFAVRALMT